MTQIDEHRDNTATSASVRLDGIPCGTLTSDSTGKLGFTYDPGWLGRDDSYPLSSCLPLSLNGFTHQASASFFANLLPESNRTITVMAKRAGVDGTGMLGLLSAVGSDCQGAVTIVPHDTPVVSDRDVVPSYDILSDRGLASRIALLQDAPLFLSSHAYARATLAGIRPKAAVIVTGGKVAIAERGTPSTHILKADTGSLSSFVQVENFCMHLAGKLGMDAAATTVSSADGIPYLTVARFDRGLGMYRGKPYLERHHQFDFGQALGCLPEQKYQKDGGPGWRHCFDLVAMTETPDRDRKELLNRAVFQFLAGNPDAHAKNYTLVRNPGGVSLSKLYGVNTMASFDPGFSARFRQMAMAVGGEYDPSALKETHWRAFAGETSLAEDLVLDTLETMASAMPDMASETRRSLRGTPGDTQSLDAVVDDIASRCARFAG